MQAFKINRRNILLIHVTNHRQCIRSDTGQATILNIEFKQGSFEIAHHNAGL